MGHAFRVAPFAGAWIETGHFGHNRSNSACRPLRGGVDRNTNYHALCKRKGWVAPFAGAWIETPAGLCRQPPRESPPSRGHRSKLAQPHHIALGRAVAPFAGGVDRLQPAVGQPYVKKDPVPFLVLRAPLNPPVFIDR